MLQESCFCVVALLTNCECPKEEYSGFLDAYTGVLLECKVWPQCPNCAMDWLHLGSHWWSPLHQRVANWSPNYRKNGWRPWYLLICGQGLNHLLGHQDISGWHSCHIGGPEFSLNRQPATKLVSASTANANKLLAPTVVNEDISLPSVSN